MTQLVVDASVVFSYLLDEDGARLVRPLFINGHSLAGPALLHIEVSNAVWKYFRKGLISVGDMELVSDRLGALGIETVPADQVWKHALTLAMDLDHPVYDCVYLATAIRIGAQLVTLDDRFRRTLAGTPWEVLVADPQNLLSH